MKMMMIGTRKTMKSNSNRFLNKNAHNKSMDVRRKQLRCYSACLLNSNGLGCRFRPRHLNRSAFRGILTFRDDLL